MRFTFDTNTANSAPGVGKMRLNNTADAATAIYADLSDFDGKDAVDWIQGFTAGSIVRLVQLSRPRAYSEYLVTNTQVPATFDFIRIFVTRIVTDTALIGGTFTTGPGDVLMSYAKVGPQGDRRAHV